MSSLLVIPTMTSSEECTNGRERGLNMGYAVHSEKHSRKLYTDEQPVNPSVCLALEKLRKKKVVALLGGKDSQAYRDRHFAQSVFSQAAKDFKDYFRIPRYDLLKRKDEEQAFDYWNSWEPSANTKLEIKARNGQMSLVG